MLNLGIFFLIIINVYIPPCLDKQTTSQHWNRLTTYMEELEQKFPRSEIILAGDFNARVGADNSRILNGLGFDQEEVLPFPFSLPICSKDSQLNFAGTCLAKFCIQFNSLWLNGLTNFENSDEFTFVSTRGCSVIDYILISPSFWDYIEDFLIGDYVLSDHLPLIMVFKLSTDPTLTQKVEANTLPNSENRAWNH